LDWARVLTSLVSADFHQSKLGEGEHTKLGEGKGNKLGEGERRLG